MAISPAQILSSQEDDYYDQTTEPSQITRLAQQHTTEGYRDGITISKHLYIQEGFDEGYILGAALGLKIGEILGILDGLVGTFNGVLKGRKDDDNDYYSKIVEELGRVKIIRDDAKKELSLEVVFGKQYFGEDGVWKWEVEEKEGEEATFDDIVEQHPLVVKWSSKADEISRELGIPLLDEDEDEEQDQN